MDYDAAVTLAETILEDIDYLEEQYFENYCAGEEFLSDVRGKVESVLETLEKRNTVTPKQYSALRNWHEGVTRWFPKDH